MPQRALIYAAIVIIAGVLATTLAQPDVLARLPLQNLLKNELHLDRSSNAGFFFWTGIAWYLKPFAGLVIDAFPLFGSRRRYYILLGAILAALGYFVLALTQHAYRDLLLVVTVINIFMVVISTTVGGYMVEIAQSVSGSGRLTALRQLVQQGCSIFSGPIAGYLASIAFGWTAASCGVILLALVPVTLFFLRENPGNSDPHPTLASARAQLRNIASARTMWAAAALMALFYAAALMALFYMAPGFATAVFYRQQNELHMDTQAQGFLGLISGVCGIVAAVGYAVMCRRLSLRTLLVVCMILGTIANLGYLFYSSVDNARVIEGLNGFGYTLAELALMDLAVRATPRGSEGLGFSLMVSVRNLALFGTDWFGSLLLDQYNFSFDTLVIANSVTTALAVPLVFLLPLVIVAHKDA